jgi:hypothetical protein
MVNNGGYRVGMRLLWWIAAVVVALAWLAATLAKR